MDCQASDSKKLFKVFDASNRKRTRRKKEGVEDNNSVATDDSNNVAPATLCCMSSKNGSMQKMPTVQGDMLTKADSQKRICRDQDSSPSVSPSPPTEVRRLTGSPRRHRRVQREGVSLALKAGLISTPRSISPLQDGECVISPMSRDPDSFIYAYLEEAIKRDKRRQRHARRHAERRISRENVEDRRGSRERPKDRRERPKDRRERPEDRRERPEDLRERPEDRRERHEDRRERRGSREDRRGSRDLDASDHRSHHHRHEDTPLQEPERSSKEESVHPAIPQAVFLKTFAQLCAKINETTQPIKEMPRTQSHKSLQCEVITRRESCEERPVRLHSQENSRDNIPSSRVRSRDKFQDPRSPYGIPQTDSRRDKCPCPTPYDKIAPRYSSKLDMMDSRFHNVPDVRHLVYSPTPVPTRSCIDHCCRARLPPDRREYRDYDESRDFVREREKNYDNEKKRFLEQTSRSFDMHREGYTDEDRGRRTTRSDSQKKRYEDPRILRDRRYGDQRDIRDKRYEERREKYFEDRPAESRDRHYSNLPSKDRRSRRNLERFERTSIASRDEEYRERDKYSEREGDSGLSVADGETSVVSGKSNYLRVMKQEISDQREAMNKMMKLWKELMMCFKGISQTQGQDKTIQDSAATVQESAATQLRLWRECMRRYETVARDVGDTDARLMEEMSKQRSEMAEMANMWQECLQRYREMSTDFNNLKQQLATSESPARAPLPPQLFPEGEGVAPCTPYRLQPGYPPMVAPAGGYRGGSPLRARASAPPPAWWWTGEALSPRRRSSPDSRGSHSRDRRHRHKDRDVRYKDKSSKPSAARTDHRHRKR